MNQEMEDSFRNVEEMIEMGIDNERIRFIALMVNDLSRNAARMTAAGAIDPAILDALMYHTNAVMSVIIAADHVPVEALPGLREKQPDPMLDFLGFDNGTVN